MTGNEPFYPEDKFISQRLVGQRSGVTIYQEALLRFMVAMQAQYGPHNAAICADAAKEFAYAYINKLNEI